MPISPRPPRSPTVSKRHFPINSMEIPPFSEAVSRICARDPRYLPEAYYFLHEGLMRTLKKIQATEKKPRQISGAELADGLREYALKEFGPLTLTVLGRWGIQTTRDFGELVFVLLDAGLLGKTDEDRIEDFDNLYSFEEAFRDPFRPAPHHSTSMPPKTRLPSRKK